MHTRKHVSQLVGCNCIVVLIVSLTRMLHRRVALYVGRCECLSVGHAASWQRDMCK
jgi:hypothetical protein